MRMMVLLAVIVSLVVGCSTTTVNQAWKDPAYTGHGIGSVMVVGFPRSSPMGHECTDDFVAELAMRGISAIRGYDALPERASKEAALAKVKDLGFEGLLVCRFLERKSEVDIPVWRFYHPYEFWPEDTDYVENNYDAFGTMMYDASTGKPIWSAVSDTYAGHSEKKVLQSYVKTMIKKMEAQQVIRPASIKKE